MRHLILLACALGALACSAAWAANDYSDNAATSTAEEQQAYEEAYADYNGVPAPELRVMGLLSKSQVQAMRDAHAAAGLALSLSIVPAGGVNAGKYYVTGTLAPEMLAAMHAAHETAGLTFDMRALPIATADGVVLGYRDDDDDDDDEDEDEDEMDDDEDDDEDEDEEDHFVRHGNTQYDHHYRQAGAVPPTSSVTYDSRSGQWQGKQAKRWHGKHGGKGRWHERGGWNWRGPNYDVRDHCGHWEQDWHQDGCGKVHVHNLADWLPNHAGWDYGWPYGGWDDDFWPYVRNDGSHVWYTGQFWSRVAAPAAPAWYDAQWTLFGDAYPDTFWISAAQSGQHWSRVWNRASNCGCGGGLGRACGCKKSCGCKSRCGRGGRRGY